MSETNQNTRKDLGPVSAYALAVANGYTGTEQEFAEYLSTAAQKAAQTVTKAGEAAASALKAEGYAVGQQNGTDVQEGSPYYENNAKHYLTLTRQAAEEVSGTVEDVSAMKALLYRERETETVLTSTESKTGCIWTGGVITGNEYLVKAFPINGSYARVAVRGYHVAPQYRTFAFYNADTIEDCNASTLVGSIKSYERNVDNFADVPAGAKLLCIAVESASDTCSAKVVEEYYPVTEIIDFNSETKLDKNQGSANAGKTLIVGNDGVICIGGEEVEIDGTLTQTGKAADAKVTGDKIALVFNSEAKELLYTILQAGVYTSNQANNITSLAAALNIVVVKKDGSTLVLANVQPITNIAQNGTTLICA